MLTSDKLQQPYKAASVWDSGRPSEVLQLQMLEKLFAAGELTDHAALRRRLVLRGELKPTDSYEAFLEKLAESK